MAELALKWSVLLMLMTENVVASNLKQAQPEYGEHSDIPHSLNIGITGLPPHFFLMNGKKKGSEMLILELLATKFDFAINVVNKGATIVTANGIVQMVIDV